jgi:hypothetical protein
MWHKRSPWRGLALLSTAALLTVLVHSAVATPQTWLAQSRGVYQTTVVTSGLAVPGGGYTDVSGATTTIRVPGSWRSGVVLVRFTATVNATSGCNDVRILVDGLTEANPGDACFGVGSGQGVNALDSMDATLGVEPGAHTIQAQQSVDHPLVFISWSLTAEVSRGS